MAINLLMTASGSPYMFVCKSNNKKWAMAPIGSSLNLPLTLKPTFHCNFHLQLEGQKLGNLESLPVNIG